MGFQASQEISASYSILLRVSGMQDISAKWEACSRKVHSGINCWYLPFTAHIKLPNSIMGYSQENESWWLEGWGSQNNGVFSVLITNPSQSHYSEICSICQHLRNRQSRQHRVKLSSVVTIHVWIDSHYFTQPLASQASQARLCTAWPPAAVPPSTPRRHLLRGVKGGRGRGVVQLLCPLARRGGGPVGQVGPPSSSPDPRQAARPLAGYARSAPQPHPASSPAPPLHERASIVPLLFPSSRPSFRPYQLDAKGRVIEGFCSTIGG